MNKSDLSLRLVLLKAAQGEKCGALCRSQEIAADQFRHAKKLYREIAWSLPSGQVDFIMDDLKVDFPKSGGSLVFSVYKTPVYEPLETGAAPKNWRDLALEKLQPLIEEKRRQILREIYDREIKRPDGPAEI